MQISYNPNVLAPAVRNEIEYYIAFSMLKKLKDTEKIDAENCCKANVGIAEKYGVRCYTI